MISDLQNKVEFKLLTAYALMLSELKFKINTWGARLLKMILMLKNIIKQDATRKSRQAHEDALSRLSHFLIFVSTII